METEQIIKERLKVIPDKIKQAIKSTDLAGKFTKIADKHGLHIDQNGSLQTETLLVMLGLESTDDFIENIQRELDISRNEAVSITQDVNLEILNSIKDSLQEIQEENEEEEREESKESSTTPAPTQPKVPISNPVIPSTTPITPIVPKTVESAGKFTIEKPPVGMAPQYNKTPVNKDVVLKAIEDPERELPAPTIDHLLSNPVTSSTQPVSPVPVQTTPAPTSIPQTPKVTPTPAPQPKVEKKPYSSDPYREPI